MVAAYCMLRVNSEPLKTPGTIRFRLQLASAAAAAEKADEAAAALILEEEEEQRLAQLRKEEAKKRKTAKAHARNAAPQMQLSSIETKSPVPIPKETSPSSGRLSPFAPPPGGRPAPSVSYHASDWDCNKGLSSPDLA